MIEWQIDAPYWLSSNWFGEESHFINFPTNSLLTVCNQPEYEKLFIIFRHILFTCPCALYWQVCRQPKYEKWFIIFRRAFCFFVPLTCSFKFCLAASWVGRLHSMVNTVFHMDKNLTHEKYNSDERSSLVRCYSGSICVFSSDFLQLLSLFLLFLLVCYVYKKN